MSASLLRALLALTWLLSAPVAQATSAGTEADEPPPPPPDGWFARYVHELIHGPQDPAKPQFLVYPVAAYAPETRLEIGLSGLYLFRARRDLDNRLSEIPLYVFYTQNRQYGLIFEHAIFSDGSRRSYLGEGMIADFPLKYYGIGLDAEVDDAVVVYARQIVARERVLFRLGDSEVFLGPEVGIASLGGVRFEAEDGGPVELPRGGEGTTNITAGVGIAHDTRHNPLNVRNGVFAEVAVLASAAGVLSDYGFHNVYADLRGYQPLGPEEDVVFAGQVVGQFGGGDLPFNELGLIGGDSLMRGYYRGRYRDRHLLAAQAELRILPLPLGFTERIGLAGFLASGTVYPSWQAFGEARPLVTAGGGVRVLTFPASDIYTRFDVGVSEDGLGYYLYVGEAF